jgi:hypothetical protein
MTAAATDGPASKPALRTRADAWLSSHPGKRATERYWLLYTPVWAGVAGLVMLSGAADHWKDGALLAFAFTLAAGAIVGPIVLRPESERGIPIHRTTAFKLGACVTAFSFLINYSQTPFFFDVLHMHYGFQTDVNIRNNPVALYVLTIPYFATYCVLCQAAYRRIAHLLRGAPRVVRLLGALAAPFAVAFFETALNANPYTRHVFCYDDMRLMLWFGTFAYGTAFCFALPVWLSIDERPGERDGLQNIALGIVAAVYADSLMLDFYRYELAPRVTTVVTGAPGLRDYERSCLLR